MTSDWETTTIGDACDITTGFPFKSQNYTDDQVHWRLLRGDNIAQGLLRWDGAKRWDPTTESPDILEKYSLRQDDVVLAMDRPWIEAGLKYAAVRDSDLPSLLVQRVARLRARPPYCQRYIRYIVGSRAFTSHILGVQTGTAVPHISAKQIADFEFAAPSPREQESIANILSSLDDKIELNRKTNETLEAIAKALFKSWFVAFDPVRAKVEGCPTGLPDNIDVLFPNSFDESGLGELPSGWQFGDLSEIASLNPESWSATSHPDQVAYLDLANVKFGKVDQIEQYSWEEAPSRARRVLRAGDTIVGTVRPGNGSYSVVTREGLTGSTGFAVLRPRGVLYREFVYLAATDRGNIDRLAHLADGGAYPAVRPELVLQTPTVVPSEAAVEAFSGLTAPLFDAVSVRDAESRILVSLRDTLLPKLISGELRVPEAEAVLEAAGV